VQSVELAANHAPSISCRNLVYDAFMSLVLLTARPDLPVNRRLVEAAAARSATLRLVDATRSVAVTGGPVGLFDEGVEAVEQVAGALARVGNWRPRSVLAALEALGEAGVPTPNPPPAIRTGRDHWEAVLALHRAGVRTPATLAGAEPETLTSAAVKQLGFPLVVKQRRSRMGVGVIRCDAPDQLEAVLDSLWRLGDEVVIQRFVPCEGVSLRLLVVGGRVVAAARFSARPGEWRSNAARGAAVESYEPAVGEAAAAVTAAAGVGLGVCGVDLLPGPDGAVVCEVNPTPGFVHLESATGLDVAGAIVEELLSLARR